MSPSADVLGGGEGVVHAPWRPSGSPLALWPGLESRPPETVSHSYQYRTVRSVSKPPLSSEISIYELHLATDDAFRPRRPRAFCGRSPPSPRRGGTAPAVKRSAERAAKRRAPRAFASPRPAQKGPRARLPRARGDPGLAPRHREEGIGVPQGLPDPRCRPQDDETTSLRATREFGDGGRAEGPVWGAPFRALEALFGRDTRPWRRSAFRPSSSKMEGKGTVTLAVAVRDCWT